jgi:hypothetical protein
MADESPGKSEAEQSPESEQRRLSCWDGNRLLATLAKAFALSRDGSTS